MKNISKVLYGLTLTSSLLFSEGINKTIIYNRDYVNSIIDIEEVKKNANNMSLLFKLEEEIDKKNIKLEEFLRKLYNKGIINLYGINSDDFQKMIDIVYDKNFDIQRIESKLGNTNFNLIYSPQIKKIEKKFDILFGEMFKFNQLNKGLIYMKYIEDNYGYINDNFINNNFNLDFYLNYYGNDNLKRTILEIDNLEGTENKIEFIDKMNNNAFDLIRYGENKSKFNKKDLEYINYLMSIIQKKLKQSFNN